MRPTVCCVPLSAPPHDTLPALPALATAQQQPRQAQQRRQQQHVVTLPSIAPSVWGGACQLPLAAHRCRCRSEELRSPRHP